MGEEIPRTEDISGGLGKVGSESDRLSIEKLSAPGQRKKKIGLIIRWRMMNT